MGSIPQTSMFPGIGLVTDLPTRGESRSRRGTGSRVGRTCRTFFPGCLFFPSLVRRSHRRAPEGLIFVSGKTQAGAAVVSAAPRQVFQGFSLGSFPAPAARFWPVGGRKGGQGWPARFHTGLVKLEGRGLGRPFHEAGERWTILCGATILPRDAADGPGRVGGPAAGLPKPRFFSGDQKPKQTKKRGESGLRVEAKHGAVSGGCPNRGDAERGARRSSVSGLQGGLGPSDRKGPPAQNPLQGRNFSRRFFQPCFGKATSRGAPRGIFAEAVETLRVVEENKKPGGPKGPRCTGISFLTSPNPGVGQFFSKNHGQGPGRGQTGLETLSFFLCFHLPPFRVCWRGRKGEKRHFFFFFA